jgi:uroporphyrinogen-III synthase
MVRMLVTRPEPDASDTAARLRALGIEPVVVPLLAYAALPTPLPGSKGFAAMVVTSGNALRALKERGDIGALGDLTLYCVGDRTAAAARSLGFTKVASASGDARDLVSLVAGAEPRGPLLYPAARDRAGDLGKALARHGLMVITTEVYEMAPLKALPASVAAELADGAIAAGLFYSRRTAETFAALTGDLAERNRLGVLCLSEAVAAPLIGAHFVRVGLADHPSEEAMMSLALSFARDQNPA